MIGTVVGGVAIVVLTACFPQDRLAFLVGLALWGAGCAFVATILRNSSLALAAQLAGITAAIIASSELGATGGANGEVFILAVIRCTEICIGIVSAGVVLLATDFGNASRRLATLFAAISPEIVGGFTGTLALAGSELPDTQPARSELIRRVIALDPIIDEAFGESAQLRYHSPVLQTAVNGLFAAIAGWRVLWVHLTQRSDDQAGHEAGVVLRSLPQELRSPPKHGKPLLWMADPTGLRRICEAAIGTLAALPAPTPTRISVCRCQAPNRFMWHGIRRKRCASMPSCCCGTPHRAPSKRRKQSCCGPWRSRECSRRCHGNYAAPPASLGYGGVGGAPRRHVICWPGYIGNLARDSARAT